jgi:HlyD family secretion protein
MNLKTKTFLIEAEFIHPPSTLFPNVTLEANVLIRTKKNALLIPREFVDAESQVTLSNGERKKVQTGLKDFKFIEIVSGLGEQDEIIKPKE